MSAEVQVSSLISTESACLSVKPTNSMIKLLKDVDASKVSEEFLEPVRSALLVADRPMMARAAIFAK